MARRKKQTEEHENHERWLVSYADFITLLFAFFVVMYAISSVNEGKYRVLSETLESVFSQPVRSKDPIQIGEINHGIGQESTLDGDMNPATTIIELPDIAEQSSPVTDTQALKTIDQLAQQLSHALAEMIESKDVIIKKTDDWLELEIKSRILFQSGESRLEKSAVPVIGEIADILQPIANPIQVEGFTDNQPISTVRFPSNWELSAARAASVVHLLDRFGITPARMSAIGYGEFQPIAPNDTETGRQKNRRVVLVILGSETSRRSLEAFNTTSGSAITAPDTKSTP